MDWLLGKKDKNENKDVKEGDKHKQDKARKEEAMDTDATEPTNEGHVQTGDSTWSGDESGDESAQKDSEGIKEANTDAEGNANKGDEDTSGKEQNQAGQYDTSMDPELSDRPGNPHLTTETPPEDDEEDNATETSRKQPKRGQKNGTGVTSAIVNKGTSNQPKPKTGNIGTQKTPDGRSKPGMESNTPKSHRPQPGIPQADNKTKKVAKSTSQPGRNPNTHGQPGQPKCTKKKQSAAPYPDDAYSGEQGQYSSHGHPGNFQQQRGPRGKQDQMQGQVFRDAQASKQMVYGVFGNCITMLEELENRELTRNGHKALPRSDIELPDQSEFDDETIQRKLDTQLILLQAQLTSCHDAIRDEVKDELKAETLHWGSQREENNLPEGMTDTYTTKLFGLLETGRTEHPMEFDEAPTIDEKGMQQAMGALMHGQQKRANLDEEFRKDSKKKATAPKLRQTAGIDKGVDRITRGNQKYEQAAESYRESLR